MCDSKDKLTTRHSYYTPIRSPKECVQNVCKSDILIPNEIAKLAKNNSHFSNYTRTSSGEYYKRYEHDEIPVKDDGHSMSDSPHDDVGTSDRKSLTNSDLDKLERKVLQSMSQELQTDGSSLSSLDTNIKFFKTTVQQIFDNFYTTMQDFELYKQRFNDILAKNKDDTVMEMEDFIKDMIQHIISSESVSNESQKTIDASALDFGTNITNSIDTYTTTSTNGSNHALENLHSVVEAYKNENYLTDSTFDENHSQIKKYTKKGEIFNIYLLNTSHCLEIKMNERNLLSEINIKNPNDLNDPKVASADNLKKLTAKKTELENYVKEQQDRQWHDIEIPVRISSAKKNIYLNEDFTNDRDKSEHGKSFMYKICNFLCKTFRKKTFS